MQHVPDMIIQLLHVRLGPSLKVAFIGQDGESSIVFIQD